MIVVIGSGPAGVASASALLALGRPVTLLDASIELEPERRERVRRMAAAAPADWSASDVAALRETRRANLGGVPLKLVYGSDYPYREVERWLPFENRGSETRPTLARGGFSSVWGAAVLPYLAEDLADWPVGAEALAPHYRAVLRSMPLAAVEDDLAEELPLHADHGRPLTPSHQARALMRDLERGRERLRAAGFRFGWSRLAVRAEPSRQGPGCAYCGMCLSGCPYGLIYDSSARLAELEATDGMRYEGGVVVERLEETRDGVEIHAHSRSDGEPRRFRAEKVLVACGVVSTTRLLLASLGVYDRPVEIRDSQYFLLPLLRFAGAGRPRHEDLHTLSQLFLELRDGSVCPHNVHLQVYGYNPIFQQVVERLLGPAATPARPLIDALLARLLLTMGYLHSDESPRIAAALRGDGRLVLAERPNPRTRPTVRRVVARLARHARDLGALPLWPLLRVAPAGRGFHSGGSFPMRERPGELECDVLGRPKGFSRVHVVDATTFPSIPSTTITLTVMANAHRIASAVAG